MSLTTVKPVIYRQRMVQVFTDLLPLMCVPGYPLTNTQGNQRLVNISCNLLCSDA